MEKIRVLIVEPIGEPKEEEIEHSLEKMQSIVGGLIEFVALEENVDLICNEEGKINNLPINRIVTNDVICGTFFITGHKNGDTISLTDKQIQKYKNYFKLRKHTIPIALIKNEYPESSDLLSYSLIGIQKLLKLGEAKQC